MTRFTLFAVILLVFLSFTSIANAACGIRVPGGTCDGATNPNNAVTCPATTTICCDSQQECPQPEELEPGTKWGACLIGVSPNCGPGLVCNSSNICVEVKAGAPVVGTAEKVGRGCPSGSVNTAIGCISYTTANDTTAFFIRWGLGIAGGIALLTIGFASYRIATSQGDPRRLQGGQELLLSAIGGLLMIMLSVFLLRFIGINLLNIF